MAVRTKELGNLQGVAGAPVTLYTCPAGKTAIVKEWSVSSNSAHTGQLTIKRGADIWKVWSGATGAGGYAAESGRFLVLEPGDLLQATRLSGSAGGDWWVSGSELDGVAS